MNIKEIIVKKKIMFFGVLLFGLLPIWIADSVSAADSSKPYLSKFREKIIEMGISEEYFNGNVILIYSGDKQKKDGFEARAVYQIKTGTWVDDYFPTDLISKGYDQPEGVKIEAWLREPGDGSFPTVWHVGNRFWHDDKVVHGGNALHEINIAISEEEAKSLAEKCLGSGTGRPHVFYSPGKGVEYVIDSRTHQARIDLETGKISKCGKLEIRAD